MTTEKTVCITAFLEQLHQEASTCETRAEVVHVVAEAVNRAKALQAAGATIAPVSWEEEELAVYQYAASVNLAHGGARWDGVVTARLITGIDGYHAVRAEIARDGNVTNPDQVQVHNLAMIGFVPAGENHHTREGAAIKTLDFLGYTYSAGAEHWRPPVGEAPDFDLLDLVAELEAAANDCPISISVSDQEAQDRYTRHLKATRPVNIQRVVKALRGQLLRAPKDGE